MEKAMAQARQESELLELVRQVAEEVLDMDLSDATPQTPLRSLGMDSADQLELVSVLEDHLEVGLPDSVFMELQTVGDLIAAFAGPRPAQPASEGPGPGRGEQRGDAS
jgi:acyl carrier protein